MKKHLLLLALVLYTPAWGMNFTVNTITTEQEQLNQRLLNAITVDEIKAALKVKADINAKDKRFGMTALHRAAYRDDEEAVLLLLNNCADVNDIDNLYGTPLHVAAFFGYFNIVKILVENGTDISIKNINHNDMKPWQTAFDVACSQGKNFQDKISYTYITIYLARANSFYTFGSREDIDSPLTPNYLALTILTDTLFIFNKYIVKKYDPEKTDLHYWIDFAQQHNKQISLETLQCIHKSYIEKGLAKCCLNEKV